MRWKLSTTDVSICFAKSTASEGNRLVQETRGWVEEKRKTVSQRSKEYAHDYRYFPEPDLPLLELDRRWVEEVRKKLPELPDARKNRFMNEYGLSPYDTNLLAGSRALADFEDEFVAHSLLLRPLQ